MIKIIKVSGFEEVGYVRKKRGLLSVSSLIFNKVVDGERDYVLMKLMGMFKRFEV